MQKFFEEYGGIVLVLIVIAVLALILGTATVTGDSLSGTGLSGVIIDAINSAVTKFTGFFNSIALPGATV